jgi:hypothetical protein
MARSTASSRVRSRSDMAMALPATQTSEKTTARAVLRTKACTLPSISVNICWNDSSVMARTGESELANSSSIRRITSGTAAAERAFTTTLPTRPAMRLRLALSSSSR